MKENKPTPMFDQLSKRELQVAMMLAVGKKNSEIADALVISVKTIDTHRQHILRKLRLRNNVELALAALREGVTELRP